MMAGSNSTAPQQRLGGVGRMAREMKAELKKVVWPTRKELINYTIVVFVTVVFISALIGIVDAIFSELFQLLMRVVG